MPLLEPEGGARPDLNASRPLAVPTEPKRSHLLDQANALVSYVAGGGGVELYKKPRPKHPDRLQLVFEVDRASYLETARAITAERTGAQPWVWTPKRGLGRRRRPS